ncbi:hypothetical protein [Novosphingobium sp. M1R2S20]|uniref:Uncharacterized protein n=1 Tax=Novosphingobium rhizovicinum TaxID=3228928 RepID=A0ABV3R7B8_9SPHN
MAGIAALSRAAHGRIAGSAMLALPLVFHQAWMYGFLNYCLGNDRPDLRVLRQSLDEMRRDRFDAIWISGVPHDQLPQVPGYAAARRLPGETMFVRR